jgi:hypothetical protein
MKRLFALTAAALLATFAFAQGEPTPPPDTTQQPPSSGTPPATTQPPATTPESSSSVFDSLDANKDGNVGKDEAQAHPTVAQHFANADANGDGTLSRAEFAATFKSQ